MAFRVAFKLNRAQHDAAYEFYKQLEVGTSTSFEEFAKQCMFYTINKCREEALLLAREQQQAETAAREQQAEAGHGNTQQRDVAGNTSSTSESEAASLVMASEQETSSSPVATAE